MNNRNVFKMMAAWFLSAAILINLNSTIFATDLDEAEKEKESLKTELEAAEELIDSLKDSREDIAYKVTELDAKLTDISTKISELSVQLEETNNKISDTSEELEVAEAEEEKQYENMKNRIRFMYENRMTANYLAALFEADSFSEFLNEVEYITSLEKYDR
ncbi:MAG: metalloendopeptidase, partial [Lachnospiraceae bacterium]|nr:metalloendopeptidase [Lachnospiraceae bacterium]